MRKLILYLLLLVALWMGVEAQAPGRVEAVSASQLEEKILMAEAPLTIFNFWATWCGPCVKEIPYFEQADESNESVKVYLVSLDFQNQQDRVQKFVSKKRMTPEVLFLDEKDPAEMMEKVSTTWSGAIPATLFVTDMGKTFFHETSFTEEELNNLIDKYLN